MNGRIIKINDLSEARTEMRRIGVDPAGIKLMAPKAVSLVVKLCGVRPVAANILKQEILSFGGDAAVAYGSVNLSVKSTDVLIFGTLKQLRALAEKCRQHQFGLPEIGREIEGMVGRSRSRTRTRTRIMGILNVTPDSFSDGGKFVDVEAAVKQAKKMIADGADIIDVGGESTRPGSKSVSAVDEIKRVVPVIKRLRGSKKLISIDTTKASVAGAAIEAGAGMINDISGLRFDLKMAGLAARKKVQICLMHIQGKPRDMQKNPRYHDLMGEIIHYLQESLAIATKAGILHSRIVVDPGLGFGKTVGYNLEILRRLKELEVLGCPILVGPSRKSFIGQVLGLEVDERLEGTLAAVAAAILNGAEIVRVHDVKEAARVARLIDAVKKGEDNG